MTQPATRDLDSIIDALEVTERELEFHADRLDRQVVPASESEDQHHDTLAADYRKGARVVRVLLRYQRGRKAREQARLNAVDGRGVAEAHVDK